MRVVMPASPPPKVRELSEKELADLCAGGKLEAGIELCCRLHERGQTPTIRTLVQIAQPTGPPPHDAFDHLADARREWGRR